LNMGAGVLGVTTDYLQVNTLTMASGEWISSDNYTQAAKVAVIGANVASTLFSGTDPVGQIMRAGRFSLQVIGVLESKGSSFTSQDDVVLVPLTALSQMSGQNLTSTGGHGVRTIQLIVTDTKLVSTVEDDITNLLLIRHNVSADSPDFTIQSTQDTINQLSQITGYMTILLGAIAGISLLVGGIGVMNIMLVSVIERTREIGIRKALGAKERDIWGQFVIEAVFLTFTGGVVGVAAGWGASILISRMLTTTLISVNIIILAVTVSIGIGLFFGFYPAWQASRLNPIEALRHE
jgi:putative ABC transport system permease protein